MRYGGWRAMLAAAVLAFAVCRAYGYEAADHEEPGGQSISLAYGPAEDVRAFGFGAGTWLRNTPVLGDYAATFFTTGWSEGFWGGVGMTLRVMPHSVYAPFLGVGGSYNHAFGEQQDKESDDGRSVASEFWAGHVEGGIKFRIPHVAGFFELALRETWTSADGRDYLLCVLRMGQGR